MLTFYYHPLSPISRRVWLSLIEKQIPFESVLVNLRGGQNKPEFLALNPFHHVPVIIDDGFKLIESLAILDYLEEKYPQPSLSPESSARHRAKTKMIQMVTVNELVPKLLPFTNASVVPVSEEQIEQIEIVFDFLNRQLDRDSIYFGGDKISLADIVVGATVPLFCRLGISLQSYPDLNNWHENIIRRQAWQQTNPSERDFQNWQRFIQLAIKRQVTKK